MINIAHLLGNPKASDFKQWYAEAHGETGMPPVEELTEEQVLKMAKGVSFGMWRFGKSMEVVAGYFAEIVKEIKDTFLCL